MSRGTKFLHVGFWVVFRLGVLLLDRINQIFTVALNSAESDTSTAIRLVNLVLISSVLREDLHEISLVNFVLLNLWRIPWQHLNNRKRCQKIFSHEKCSQR
jgi:hypothetical protein